MKMKKGVLVFLAIFTIATLLCSVQSADATKAGYTHDSYSLVNDVTLDGQWTGAGDTEWNDAKQEIITSDSAIFRSKEAFDMSGESMKVNEYYLIEVVTDTTNDAGDYVELVYDATLDGGTTPQADDIKVVISGHPGTIEVYSGTGTDWTATTFTSENVQCASTLTATPLSSTPHWCYELIIEKMGWSIGQNYGLFVGTYDASDAGAGIQAWPAGSTDMVPDDFGAVMGGATKPEGFVQDNDIPEGFGLGVIVALTVFAGLAGACYFRRNSAVNLKTLHV